MGPKLIGPSEQTVPNQFGPQGQIVHNQFGPSRQMVPRIFRLSRGTGCGDPEIRGPNWLGTIFPGEQIFRDHLSIGTEVQGSNGFGTKCVAAGTGLTKISSTCMFVHWAIHSK